MGGHNTHVKVACVNMQGELATKAKQKLQTRKYPHPMYRDCHPSGGNKFPDRFTVHKLVFTDYI